MTRVCFRNGTISNSITIDKILFRFFAFSACVRRVILVKSFFTKSEAEGFVMKKEIHPRYEEATISCACGNVIHTRSTKKEMSVNTCAACHPYFTGQQTMIDTEGRVDSFMKRYKLKKA